MAGSTTEPDDQPDTAPTPFRLVSTLPWRDITDERPELGIPIYTITYDELIAHR